MLCRAFTLHMACLKSESHSRQQQAPGVYAAKHARASQRAHVPPGPAMCSAFTLLMACTKTSFEYP